MTAGAEGSPVFDYTSLDFASVEQDLIRYAQSRFGDEAWTDLNETNEGRRLIELLAYATDLLSYTGNAHALETVVASLIREQNFRNIAKTYDFELSSASAARTTLRFQIDPGYLPLLIPATFKVGDKATGTIVFQPDVDGTATTETYEVTATQGDEVVGEVLGVSDGTAGQRFQLARISLIDGTLVVSVGGTPYTKIINFIEVGPTALVYTLETDEDGVTTVIFGDNINGKQPPLGQSATATYKTGGGSSGNLPVDMITRAITLLPGVLTITNITTAEGGGPKQSLASAKRQLPLALKASERAVTTQDYATLAVQLVPGVSKATAVAGLYQAGGAPIILLVVPNGGGDVPSSLANLIVTTLRFGTSTADRGRSLAGRRIFVRNPVYVDLMLVVDAFVQRGSAALVVGDRVRAAYAARYGLTQAEFGLAVDTQDAYNTVDPVEQSIDGLQRVFLRKFTVRPYCGRYLTRPTSGNGEAEVITVTEAVRRREWHIQIQVSVGPTPEFSVYERRLGTLTGISDSSLEDDAAVYAVDELVDGGFQLHVREQEQDEVFAISANTQTSITITGASTPGGLTGLLTLATTGDTYAAERLDPTLGRIFRCTATVAALAGQPDVTVSSVSGLTASNKVLVRDAVGTSAVMVIQSIVGLVVTFDDNLPFALAIGATLDWYWESQDGTVGFALVQGTSSFVAGDVLYVDTYAMVGDIQLRPENFPVLDEADLVINTIGGVR